MYSVINITYWWISHIPSYPHFYHLYIIHISVIYIVINFVQINVQRRLEVNLCTNFTQFFEILLSFVPKITKWSSIKYYFNDLSVDHSVSAFFSVDIATRWKLPDCHRSPPTSLRHEAVQTYRRCPQIGSCYKNIRRYPWELFPLPAYEGDKCQGVNAPGTAFCPCWVGFWA